MAIDYDHLRNILATAIRNAAHHPDGDDGCIADAEECLRLHPIHEAGTTNGVVDEIYADVDGLVEVIIQALDEERFVFRPFVARSGWNPWRSA